MMKTPLLTQLFCAQLRRNLLKTAKHHFYVERNKTTSSFMVWLLLLFLLAMPPVVKASPGATGHSGANYMLDNLPPVAVCISTPLVIYLNASGNAVLIPSQLNGGSSDPEGGPLTYMASRVNFTCSDIGSNQVDLTVTDNTGQWAVCAATVIVADNIPPTALCKNISVMPNGNGDYFLQASDVNLFSTDNCGISSMTVTPAIIQCAHQSIQEMVTLTVTDFSGNSSTCISYVIFLGDSDCDGVGDLCDQCPGGNDQIDNDNNDIPDCAEFTAGNNIPAEWKCGSNLQKVLLCHLTPGNPEDRNTICVSPSAVAAHLAHGDYMGPCDVSVCNIRKAATKTDELSVGVAGDILLYPNPATSLVYLDFTTYAGNPATISVYNDYGQVVYSRKFEALPEGKFQIPLDGYHKGLYYVSIHGNDFSRMLKLQLIAY